MTRKRGRVNTAQHSEQVRTNLTVDQYNNLYDLAEAAGMAVSAYVRRLIEQDIYESETARTLKSMSQAAADLQSASKTTHTITEE